VSRADQRSRAYALSLAGTASLALGPWTVDATSTFGRGRTHLAADYYYAGVSGGTYTSRYTNRTVSGELAVDGPLLALPGGDVRLAAGAGFRNNGFESLVGAASIQNYDKHQNSRYAFGELNLPVLGPNNALPLVRRLDISAAVRYEDYEGVGDIATPKFGIVYAPNTAIELRASWGRSFRAPSFYDLYGVTQASVYPVTRFGGMAYPAGATAVLLQGGNTDLKPERATSWSATIAIHPPALPGASLEVSYFSTHYINRVVAPITVFAQALTNPAYASLVTYAPGAGQVASAIAGSQYFFNYTGSTYDPASVVALVDGRQTNVGRQEIKGLDVQARYRTGLLGGFATFNLNATYLESEQQISPGLPVEVLAGRLFSPAHWRARAGVTCDAGACAST
jgi:outer membrane receptor protein involved in Fe transport